MPKQTFFNLVDEKRNHIIECALDEFAAYPYEKASISRIVSHAGIAKGSFYQYFEDKLDLYIYVLQLMGELKMEYLSKLDIKLENVDFFEHLRGLYYGGFMFAKSYPRLSRIGAFLMKSNDNELRESIKDSNYEMAAQYFKGLLDRASENGFIREDVDKDLLVHMIINLQLVVVEFYFKKYDAEDYDDANHELMNLINQLMDLIKKGIQK